MGNKSNGQKRAKRPGKTWEAQRDTITSGLPRACNGSMWHGLAPEAITHVVGVAHRSGQLDKHGRGHTLIGHAAQQRFEARMLTVAPRHAP